MDKEEFLSLCQGFGLNSIQVSEMLTLGNTQKDDFISECNEEIDDNYTLC